MAHGILPIISTLQKPDTKSKGKVRAMLALRFPGRVWGFDKRV